MEKYLSEIEAALSHGLCFIALQSTLTLPDICGALTSDGTERVKERYVNWYNQYFQPKYQLMLSADDCYRLRCTNLHQGSFQHDKSSFTKIIFIDSDSMFDNNTISITTPEGISEKIYTLHIKTFCTDMINAVREWLQIVKNNDNFKKNYSKMVKVHEEGLPSISWLVRDAPIIY